MTETNVQPNHYGSEQIQVLEGLEAVRKRPGMYIGSTDERGLHHLVYEIVDNSIDEALAGYCKNIVVTIGTDYDIEVQDDGRGFPTDIHPKMGKPAVEVCLTVLHAGGKFGGGGYKVSGGLHGVGASVVNALSEKLRVTVYQKGHIFQQEYVRGKPTGELTIIGDTERTGTTIWFKPDPEIFETLVFDFETLKQRLREMAFLNKGIRITLRDERDGREQVYHYEGGIRSFVEYLNKNKQVMFPTPIYIEGEENGTQVEVALQWNDSYNENVYTFANNIHTPEGGTHLAGFRSALTRVITDYGKKRGILKEDKDKLSGDDIREGLTAIVSVKLTEPQFEGQTKTKLGNSEVSGAVQQAVGEALSYYLEEHPKEAQQICDKVILAATARIAARKARESVQRKNPMTGGGLPGKLADCSNKDPKECEIFLVEGDSAGGSAKQGRDRYTQAILPLRGKILNVEKVMWHKVFESESVMNIIQSIGVRFGVDGEEDKEANIDKLSYDKIIIMTDADVDGSHIDTLIMTLFYRFMPRVIKEGHLYIASAPLYLVSYKNAAKEYCYTDQQLQAFIDKYAGGEADSKSIHIQRYKGLGEMNPEQLWETTMDPKTRLLKQVTIENAAEADEIFSMLMGDDVEPRRAFIEEHATYANIDA